MKITATLHTLSRVGAQKLESRIERVAHEAIVADLRSEHTRTVVSMTPKGEAIVTTYRLATGGDPSSTESVNWCDDATITVPATRAERTHVEITPETTMSTVEQFAF